MKLSKKYRIYYLRIYIILTFCLIAKNVFSSNTYLSSMQLIIDDTGRKVIRHIPMKKSHKINLPADVRAEEIISKFLFSAYQPEPSDPPYILNDIKILANYYAKYPMVVSLFEEFEKINLKYQAGTWETRAFGSDTHVDSVTVYFDTRFGAKFCFEGCNISPADALLHELLHAKLMHQQHFVETGGMLETIYLFEHEREVIRNENKLYNEMNEIDGLARPLRNRHASDMVRVSNPLFVNNGID